jgi:hypothetical protein
MIILPDLHVQMDEQEHAYFTDAGPLPDSVTQIMRFMSRELYDGIPAQSLAIAAERGQRVHKQTYWLDTCGYTDTDDDTEPYIEAYRQFKADYNPIWIAREWMGYHKTLRFPGTIDGIGYMTPDDGTGVDVVDLKSTTQFHPVMLKTQVSGYESILKSWGVKVRRRYGLCLLPKRDPPYLFAELPDGYLLFINCLSLHNAMATETKP